MSDMKRKTDTEKAMAYHHRQIAAGYVLVSITAPAELRADIAALARDLRGGNKLGAPETPPRVGPETGKTRIKAWVPAGKAEVFRAETRKMKKARGCNGFFD